MTLWSAVVRRVTSSRVYGAQTTPVRTWWRQRIDGSALDEPLLEVVLPEKAELTSIPAARLRPGAIDELWREPVIKVAAVHALFDGKHTFTVSRGGFDEPVPIPSASREAVDEAIRAAVRDGQLWLRAEPASLLGEEIPPGLLVEGAELQAPPDPISTISLLPDALPQAWQDGRTTALSIGAALSQRAGSTLPWSTIRAVLDGAFRTRLIERVEGVGVWPCDYSGAGAVSIQLPREKLTGGTGTTVAGPVASPPNIRVSPELVLKANQLQDLNDVIPELLRVAAGHELTFKMSVAVKGSQRPKEEIVQAINALLKQVGEGLEVL